MVFQNFDLKFHRDPSFSIRIELKLGLLFFADPPPLTLRPYYPSIPKVNYLPYPNPFTQGLFQNTRLQFIGHSAKIPFKIAPLGLKYNNIQ